MSECIHIVCLDAPSPPDYGGAIDMFYKIKALGEAGSKIILHYFQYRAGRNTEGLEKYCDEIHAYSRAGFFSSFFKSRSYIVDSRINGNLIRRLRQDDHPVLLEGVHCTGILPYLGSRRVICRLHNDEAMYYDQLAHSETSFWKHRFFSREARKLKQYQAGLSKSLTMACLSQKDLELMRRNYALDDVHFIPCFIPWKYQDELVPQNAAERYCLYHGNMSIRENEAAVTWLVENVFRFLEVPFLIAGKGISAKLMSLSATYKNVFFEENPGRNELDELVRNAHVNVLPSLNQTGVKLKLLHAALEGKFCLTNRNGIEGSGITKGINVEDGAAAWIAAVGRLMDTDFTRSAYEERSELAQLYNNNINAEKLNALW